MKTLTEKTKDRILHFNIQQRTPAWFEIRVGKFTSSQIFKLFTQATKTERTAAALKEVNRGAWLSEDTTATTSEINFAAKQLDILGADLLQLKQQIKAGLSTSKTQKVFEFCSALKNVSCFSQGAKTHILEKASEFLFSSSDFKFANDSMQWGLDNEHRAKETYLDHTGFSGLDVGFCEFGEDIGSSPDLLVNKQGLAEFKCPNQVNHLKNILHIKTAEDLKRLSVQYWFQCQHQIFCTGRKWCDFVSFHPDLLNGPYSNLSLHIVRIEKDEKIQRKFEKVLPLAVKLRDKQTKEILSLL
jgi:YqaJ-like viral recombinase domain